jgi:glycosyltransferase involved in cell wall biosynthesis
MICRLRDAIRACRPDAVLTYNWGTIDGVIAARSLALPAIHTEDGFGADEAVAQKLRRVWYRRAVLRHASRVIAPSEQLRCIMRHTWRLPECRVVYIPNGVDVELFRPARGRQARNEIVIGTAANLRPEKRLELLLDVFARVASAMPARLRIAGEGAERAMLEQKAGELSIADRVEFLGHQEDLLQFYHSLDVFALTSSTEQMPLSVLEAMACGLPVVSTNVGDVWNMLAEANRRFVVGAEKLADALAILAVNEEMRAAVGQSNRERCVCHYPLAGMFEQYRRLYRGVCAPTAQPSRLEFKRQS